MVDFLIIGPENVITYKDIFPLVKDGYVSFGWNRVVEFDGTDKKFGNIRWFSNISDYYAPRLVLSKKYVEGEYKKFDNYDAINIDKVSDIPYDYDGVMGVTMRFIEQWNPEQFEIVGFRKGLDGKDLKVDGEWKYIRILIKRK